MKKEHILVDVIALLMVSFSAIVTVFQLVNRFMTPLYGAILIIAGLVSAIIFLFIDEGNRRNMRIVSVACNSVAIGAVFGVLFLLLELQMTVLSSVIIALIFAGIVFLTYYFFYCFGGRLLPALIGGVILVIGACLYMHFDYPALGTNLNIYVIMFAVIAVIHYIVALIVVNSKEYSVVDGMAYGYFGITLAILIVAGIFLLAAADGDLDIDIDFGGGSSSNSSSKPSNATRTRVTSKASRPIISDKAVDTICTAGEDIAYVASSIASDAADPVVQLKNQQYMLQNAYYIAYLGLALNALTIEQIKELNMLEYQYIGGVFTVEEYNRKLNKYK